MLGPPCARMTENHDFVWKRRIISRSISLQTKYHGRQEPSTVFFSQGRSAQKMMVGKESFPSEAKTATFQGENLLFHLRDSLTSIEALRKAVLG